MTPSNENQIASELKIPAYRYLLDHHLGGRPILPAASILLHISEVLRTTFPAADAFTMLQASFDRPLFFDSCNQTIDAKCTLDTAADGTIRATLSTLTKIESISSRRTKDHASVRFPCRTPGAHEIPKAPFPKPTERNRRISNSQLYSEIVQFGKNFQSVQGEVLLFKDAALAEVCAMPLPGSEGLTGSLFPLDGAMHTACAWGWAYEGITAFPVGFKTRVILDPIRSGETVQCLIQPIAADKKTLTFNLWLYDVDRTIREVALGVIMKAIPAFLPVNP